MEIKATYLATDQAIGFIARHHHRRNRRLIIAHNLASSGHRDPVAANHLMVVGSVILMTIVIARVKYLHILIQIYTQAQTVNLDLHPGAATN